MSDDTTIKAPQDPNTINMGQPHEVNYWTQELRCTKAQLQECVSSVGTLVSAVKACLAKKRP
jgi:hypothetical protein